MAKQTKTEAVNDLEELAVRLDGMVGEAEKLGADKAAKTILNAAKRCRWADKQHETRRQKVGKLVVAMKEKGMSPEEIVKELSR
jgi:hypothetical protein